MTGAINPPTKDETFNDNTNLDANILDENLDLSYPSPGFFEGAEKLLEIVFKSDCPANAQSDNQDGRGGLRCVDREVWSNLLKLVNCEIVSTLCNECMDSYVLSESSLFVYPRKMVLKTCGTTTLLNAVTPFLELARQYGLVEIENVFYSRKCFIEPERQIKPHGNFEDEVKELKRIFKNGVSFVLGPMDNDHWYLFMAGEAIKHIESPETQSILPDHTLEILMHDLDPRAMRHFYRNEKFVSTRASSKASGILDLIPEAAVDDLVFDPCGYSSNGIVDDSYFTIHVTPQPECSFASFETNVPYEQYTSLINKVIRVFCPSRFTVTLLTSETAICGKSSQGFNPKKIHGFAQTHNSFTQFGSYNLTFAHFTKRL